MQRTELEIARGCKEDSKIFEVADDVRARYLAGETFSEIAASYPGVTRNMIAGYVFRNKIQRNHSELVEAKIARLRGKKTAGLPKAIAPKVATLAKERRYDVLSWDGETIAKRVTGEEARKIIGPSVTEQKFDYLLDKDRQVVTTSYTVIPSD